MSDEPQRPTGDNPNEWKAYWTTQGMAWRTEPEIDEERQRYLAERRAIQPDIEKGVYPFNNIKLDRADVEWLIAVHHSRNVQESSSAMLIDRQNIDLRGAILDGANLRGLNLRGVMLARAQMNGADLTGARLEGADLRKTVLIGADMEEAWFSGADLREARLEAADLSNAHVEPYIAQPNEAASPVIPLRNGRLLVPPADLRGAFMDSATNLRNVSLRGWESYPGALSQTYAGME